MNKFILAILLLTASLTASANGYGGNTFLNQFKTQKATGGDGGNVDIDQEKPAVSSAVAPSVGTYRNCAVSTQESKAVSVFFISVSGTTGVKYHGLCLAIMMEQWDIAEKMMCKADSDYAKANPKC